MDDRSVTGEIFNVGSANRISILDLAKRVIATTESESGFVFVPYEQVYGGIEDMLHRIPSIEKIKADDRLGAGVRSPADPRRRHPSIHGRRRSRPSEPVAAAAR